MENSDIDNKHENNTFIQDAKAFFHSLKHHLVAVFFIIIVICISCCVYFYSNTMKYYNKHNLERAKNSIGYHLIIDKEKKTTIDSLYIASKNSNSYSRNPTNEREYSYVALQSAIANQKVSQSFEYAENVNYQIKMSVRRLGNLYYTKKEITNRLVNCILNDTTNTKCNAESYSPFYSTYVKSKEELASSIKETIDTFYDANTFTYK